LQARQQGHTHVAHHAHRRPFLPRQLTKITNAGPTPAARTGPSPQTLITLVAVPKR